MFINIKNIFFFFLALKTISQCDPFLGGLCGGPALCPSPATSCRAFEARAAQAAGSSQHLPQKRKRSALRSQRPARLPGMERAPSTATRKNDPVESSARTDRPLSEHGRCSASFAMRRAQFEVALSTGQQQPAPLCTPRGPVRKPALGDTPAVWQYRSAFRNACLH